MTYEFFVSCHGVVTEFQNDISNTVALINLPGVMVQGYTIHLLTMISLQMSTWVNFWAVYRFMGQIKGQFRRS